MAECGRKDDSRVIILANFASDDKTSEIQAKVDELLESMFETRVQHFQTDVPKFQSTHVRKGRRSSFVSVLRRMINDGHGGILSWSADGQQFQIKDIHQLAVHVLPQYFSHSKFSSFQRQLNYFHFIRCDSFQQMVYTHSEFHRDKPELDIHIRKRKNTRKIESVLQVEWRAPTPPPHVAESESLDEASISSKSTSSTGLVHAVGIKRSRSHQQEHPQVKDPKRCMLSQETAPSLHSLSLVAELALSQDDEEESDLDPCSDVAKDVPSGQAEKDEHPTTTFTFTSTPDKPATTVTFASNLEKGNLWSLEKLKESLPMTSFVRDPRNFSKPSEIDRHGVRFKIEGEHNWRWKCRYCSHTLLVGHGAPNVHLKKKHPDIWESTCAFKNRKLTHDAKVERDVKVTHDAKVERDVTAESDLEHAVKAEVDGCCPCLSYDKENAVTKNEGGMLSLPLSRKGQQHHDSSNLLSLTRPRNQQHHGSSNLLSLLESTRPRNLPQIEAC
jgi:hypothetical protein